MSKVILVHGAFNELWGPNELKARWMPCCPCTASGTTGSIFTRTTWRCASTATSSDAIPARKRIASSRCRWPVSPRRWLILAGVGTPSPCSARRPARRRSGTVDMVTTMTTEPDLREQAPPAHRAAGSGTTPGSWADTRSGPCSPTCRPMHRWRSIPSSRSRGSPLASPMVFGSLEPAPVDGKGVWPGSDPDAGSTCAPSGDKAAGGPAGRPMFGPRVEEVLVDNGHRTRRSRHQCGRDWPSNSGRAQR